MRTLASLALCHLNGNEAAVVERLPLALVEHDPNGIELRLLVILDVLSDLEHIPAIGELGIDAALHKLDLYIKGARARIRLRSQVEQQANLERIQFNEFAIGDFGRHILGVTSEEKLAEVTQHIKSCPMFHSMDMTRGWSL